MHPRRVRQALLLLWVMASACQAADPEAPGNLVPATADQDPALPQLTVDVAGHRRALHLQTFGDAASPVALVLPGGPGADFRLLLPLASLADRYRVVLWDQRGMGLSERVTAEELTTDAVDEEIAAVRRAFSPDGPVTLIGHSYGAVIALRHAARHPEAVSQLVLVEPGPLTEAGRGAYDGGSISYLDGQDFFWANEWLSSRDHATIDFKALQVLREANRGFFCDDRIPAPDEYPLWRFGGYAHHVLTFGPHEQEPDLVWAPGAMPFRTPLLVVAGTCGAASADFQRTYNLPGLPGATFEVVEGAGHVTLFTEYAPELLAVLRRNLESTR